MHGFMHESEDVKKCKGKGSRIYDWVLRGVFDCAHDNFIASKQCMCLLSPFYLYRTHLSGL